MSLASRSNLFRSAPLRSPSRQLQPRRGLITVNLPGSGSRKLLIISGFLGGVTATVVGGYAFYHWSGLKSAVDVARHPVELLKKYRSRRETSTEAGVNVQPETSAQILTALRLVAKAYVAPIPGAGILVDAGFDEIDKAVDTHKDEAASILKSAYSEVQTAVETRGGDAKAAAWDVLIILRNRLGQIQALASAAGQDKIGPIFEHIPGFHEHASRHISGIRESLLPVVQKSLEKGRGVLSGLSRRSNSAPSQTGSGSSAAKLAPPNSQVQMEDSSETVPDEQTSR